MIVAVYRINFFSRRLKILLVFAGWCVRVSDVAVVLWELSGAKLPGNNYRCWAGTARHKYSCLSVQITVNETSYFSSSFLHSYLYSTATVMFPLLPLSISSPPHSHIRILLLIFGFYYQFNRGAMCVSYQQWLFKEKCVQLFYGVLVSCASNFQPFYPLVKVWLESGVQSGLFFST